MLSRSVGLVAACAVSVSAFLLPPNLQPAVNTFDISPAFADAKSISFHLPCPQCAFGRDNVEDAEVGEDMVWIQGGAHDLLLNITLSEDRQSLLLGGSVVYPQDPKVTSQSVQVHQIPSGADVSELEAGQMTRLKVTESVTSYSEDPYTAGHLSTINFEIFSLNLQSVRVGGVSITVGKLAEELVLLSVQAVPPPPFVDGLMTPGRPQHGKPQPPKECKNLPAPLCALTQMVESHLQSFKHGAARKFRPCPGRKPGPHHRFGQDGRPIRHHGRPHHERPHGHGHEHHHRHGFRTFVRAFVRGFLAVLVPIMAGIAVGMGVSLLGLLLSRLITFIWSKFSSRDSYVEIPQEPMYVEQDGKIVAEMAAPPVYEEAPPHEEVDEKA